MIDKSWKELALTLANENHLILCRFYACNCGCVERRSEITLDINKKAQEELEGL